MKYNLDNVCTGDAKADNMNSLILEYASEIAGDMTERECNLSGIVCYNTEIENSGAEVLSYTEKAQDIFDVYYDSLVDDFYKFINLVLEIDKQ